MSHLFSLRARPFPPRYCANPMEATATEASATAAAPEAAPVQPWFNEWAASKGIDGFSRLLQEGGLTGFVVISFNLFLILIIK